jgi:hypothetical protein
MSQDKLESVEDRIEFIFTLVREGKESQAAVVLHSLLHSCAEYGRESMRIKYEEEGISKWKPTS